ncbi:hypothetical protein LPJ59_006422 [Coemansia sp. RSA 2399]|nr:hypothetical protein LPJ59_006422 [Coemansia sp. RSA 2399]KAJ1888221.1 hypothetical protein LPJ81_006367 [Coemansia sp. IMI 209127]
MQTTIIALAAAAAVVAANPPPPDHQKVYTTVFGGDFVANPQPVVAQPATVVQNAGQDTTTTITHTNGAASNVVSLGSVLLAGAALFSYF